MLSSPLDVTHANCGGIEWDNEVGAHARASLCCWWVLDVANSTPACTRCCFAIVSKHLAVDATVPCATRGARGFVDGVF